MDILKRIDQAQQFCKFYADGAYSVETEKWNHHVTPELVEDIRQYIESLQLTLMHQQSQQANGDASYEFVDRYLRNNLSDDDYSEYSEALDRVPTPAPPPAMHLSEILAEKGITLRTEFEPKTEQIVDSNKMVGERAGLIARLREAQVMMDYDPIEAHAAMGAAIDMLEADTKEIERVTEMAHSEKRFADMHYTEKKAIKAQQVAVPAGYALVPIEPTPEMMSQMPASSNSLEWKEYYAAMLAAAPQGDKT